MSVKTPTWARTMLAKYDAGIAHMFTLHFNVADYAAGKMGMRAYLAKLWMTKGKEIVAYYDRASGVTFALESMKDKALKLLGLDQQPDEALAALQAVSGAPAGGVSLPRAPGQALPLLERLLRAEDADGKTVGVAVIVEFAEAIAPEGDFGSMSPEDRDSVILLQKWARDPGLANLGNPVILLTANLTDLHSAIRAASSRAETLLVPLPDLEERQEFISELLEAADGAEPPRLEGMNSEQFAATTAGLSRVNIEDIELRAAELKQPISRDLVRERKREIVSSEFGDVIEIMEPSFGFEAVGGLEHVKRFMLDEVVNPIRAGRLTEVPMGVAFFGPPGTGKTAIMQAGAKESGFNAVVLNLGKILGQYVGSSLAGEEEIILFSSGGGLAQRMTIAAATVTRPDALVPTVSEEGVAQLKPVLEYIEHAPRPTVLEIKTRTGRRIRVTHDHSLFIRHGDRLVEARGDAIQVGDKIAVPCGWTVPSSINSTVNLIDLIQEKGHAEDWVVTNVHEILTDTQVRLATGTASSGYINTKYYFYRDQGRVPLSLVMGVATREQLRKATLSRRSGNFNHPVEFHLSKEMAFLAGLWLADGSISNGTLRLSCHEKEVSTILLELGPIKVTVHPKPGIKAADLFVSDEALSQILMHLGCQGTGTDKRVPAWVLGAEDELAAAYIRGYFTGDGSFSGHVLEADTISTALAGDMAYLLARLGVIASIKERDVTTVPPSGKPHFGHQYRLTISRAHFLHVFLNRIGFAQAWKNDAIADHLCSIKYTWKTDLTNDVYWDSVTSITEVPYAQPVYDIEVADTHRFTAGYGGLLVHNSERNLEKALKAIDALRPVFVFIDEVDQAGIGRGQQGDSGVGNRLFKRLLEYISDTSHRGQVVFFMASNRPDLMDAALKRPGRLDAKIPFVVPEDTEREAIFKAIATKYGIGLKVPAWGEVVAKTKGYTGAEIESIVIKARRIAQKAGRAEVTLEDLQHAVWAIAPSTGEIEFQTLLAIRECNDKDLLPPAYQAKLDNRESLSAEIDKFEEKLEASGRRSRR